MTIKTHSLKNNGIKNPLYKKLVRAYKAKNKETVIKLLPKVSKALNMPPTSLVAVLFFTHSKAMWK